MAASIVLSQSGVGRRAYIQTDSPGGSTRRGQRKSRSFLPKTDTIVSKGHHRSKFKVTRGKQATQQLLQRLTVAEFKADMTCKL